MLMCRLRIAEIIPTVFDTFEPQLTLSIFWENATAEVGNTIDPSRTQKAPDIQLIDHVPGKHGPASFISDVQLTIALTDPDAPSRDNPEWSEICHWIATDVHITRPSDLGDGFYKDVKEIMPYKPPGPPPKTGKHRYVFVALAPKNGTTEELSLSKPSDRQHWGYKHERQGLRKWAKENGLEVVGRVSPFVEIASCSC
jgi:phosphatidylethanolamine-binding protein